MKKLGFEGSLKEFFEHLRTDPQFYYTTKEDMMQAYKDTCYKKIRPTLTKLFKKIPKSPMVYALAHVHCTVDVHQCFVLVVYSVISRIEPLAESKANGPAAFYLAGTLDGSRPGVYYVNANSLKMK